MSLRSIAHVLQDRLLAKFGRAPGDRVAVVRDMVTTKRGATAGYWLQLIIATMLATLGLALNSTAVVIGAMLIAPLMRPLVELAMGLATGSAALALRAAIKTVASIAVVVLVAIAITWSLPFREITTELAARTAPSLLDLFVAAACALAAAYASLRADADIATTAAGTSIGISLVPPLCACGYGLALGDPAVSRGAALLFTTNLSGILVVAAAVFVVSGFAQVDIRHEEEAFDELSARAPAVRIGRAWSRITVRRLGPLARVVPPLLLLGVVFVPLQRAVGEITRRNEIQKAVAKLLDGDRRRVVQYTLDQPVSGAVLRVIVVGDAHTASELEKDLRTRLTGLDVQNPRVSVWAVPDAAAVSALAHRVDELPPPVVPEPAPATAHRYSSEIASALRAAWPSSETGEVVAITLDVDRPEHLHVIHLGQPLGAAALKLLARVLEPDAGPMEITEDALTVIEAPTGEGIGWLVRAADLIARSRLAPTVQLCATIPAVPAKQRRDDAGIVAMRTTFEALRSQTTSLTAVDGDRWRMAPVVGNCSSVGLGSEPSSQP